jgi:hypothetical protein
MHVIDKEGIRLDNIYTNHDRFLEDIDDYINENHVFLVSKNNPIDLMDVVCGHLNYWQYETYSDNQQAKFIYDECFQQNEIINRLIRLGDPIPELVIYEFNGISVYDELRESNVIHKETYETIEVQLEYNGVLYLSAEELAELGGEINLPEDEDDEVLIDLLNWGNVYYFMNEDDENKMGENMIKCIEEINKIYSDQGLRLIEITD